jgi:WD40 repeat protein
VIPAEPGVVTTIAFSPDGRFLATGQSDGGVKMWDVASGRETQTLSGHTASVTSVAFSPNGRWLASGSWDKSVALWEVATGKRLVSLTGHTNWVNSIVFSSDSTRLASGGNDGLVDIWQIPGGRNLSSSPNLENGIPMGVNGLAFSFDGDRLAGVAIGGGGIWNGKTGGQIRRLEGLSPSAEIVRFSRDGKQLIVTGKDGNVEVLDPVTGERKAQFSVEPVS